MPITETDIDRELARRDQLAAIDAALDALSDVERPSFRGAVAQLHALLDEPTQRAAELMIAGPAETGKTFGALFFLDLLMRLYPGAQATICRKVRVDMDGSVLNTWRRVIALRGGVEVYGGEKPVFYDYANGSRVWVAGLDKPGAALSSERDFVYVNQAEELQLDDWQTLTTRTTGRGAVAPWTMLFGDCNPGPPTHWIINRPSLKLLHSRHEDNPSLYTDDGELTAQGVRTMATLDALEGVLKERLRWGRWVAAEGVVYPGFDRAVHMVKQLPAGWEQWRKVRAIDFGYTNPFVCLWAAIDPDGRIYIYRQIYMSGRTVDVHAKDIQELERWYLTWEEHEQRLAQLSDAERQHAATRYREDPTGEYVVDLRTNTLVPHPEREIVQSSVADHDAGDRATLVANRIITIPAKKEISPGLQAVAKRLRKAGDKLPRLFILEGCVVERDSQLATQHHPLSLEQEFEVYSWPKGVDGKPVKETPIDMYNHALDALRYLVRHIDRSSQGIMR